MPAMGPLVCAISLRTVQHFCAFKLQRRNNFLLYDLPGGVVSQKPAECSLGIWRGGYVPQLANTVLGLL